MRGRRMKWPIHLVILVGTASAQTVDARRMHEASIRWVEYYAVAYRVPVELIEAIIDEESGWNPYAVSSKGAAGIMQLMPQTAIRFGVHNRMADRKSTRLNSSHPSISYAVFCLKKKIEAVSSLYVLSD